jgi:hypothetical protein
VFKALQISSVTLAAIALTFSASHAFELPGKKRLSRDTYLAVQTIYYPGFTVGGVSEPLSILAVLLLLVRTRRGATSFWPALTSLMTLTGMHAIFWIVTQPVNTYWLRGAWWRSNRGR